MKRAVIRGPYSARYMALETIAPVSNNPIVILLCRSGRGARRTTSRVQDARLDRPAPVTTRKQKPFGLA
jgi:hypothetical protein